MEYTGIVSVEWTGTLAVLDTPTGEHFPRMIKKTGRVFPKDHPTGAQQTLPLRYLPAPAPDFSHAGAQQMGIITDVWYDAPRDAYPFDDPAREQQHAPWLCASGIAYGDLAELLLTGEPVGVGVDLGTLAESVPAAVQTITGPDGKAIQQLTRWALLGATCYGPGHRGAFGDTAVIRAKTTPGRRAMTPQDIQAAPGPYSTAISVARAQAGAAVFKAGTGPAPPDDDPDPDSAVRPLGTSPLDGPFAYLSSPYRAAHRTANRFADAAVSAFLGTLAATDLGGLSVSEVWEAIQYGA